MHTSSLYIYILSMNYMMLYLLMIKEEVGHNRVGQVLKFEP